jgi:hypothetical protein
MPALPVTYGTVRPVRGACSPGSVRNRNGGAGILRLGAKPGPTPVVRRQTCQPHKANFTSSSSSARKHIASALGPGSPNACFGRLCVARSWACGFGGRSCCALHRRLLRSGGAVGRGGGRSITRGSAALTNAGTPRSWKRGSRSCGCPPSSSSATCRPPCKSSCKRFGR